MQPDVSIILPFHNAQEYAATAIEGVHKALSGGDYSFEIVAVQNGSRDRTGEILADLRNKHREVRIVSVDRYTGYGDGILQGLSIASGKALGWMRADSRIPAEAVPRLLRQMNRTCSDMGYGYAPEGAVGLNRLVEKLFGLRTGDVHGQPKLLTRRVYNSMRLRSQGSFIDAEVLLKARRMGAAICQIEVDGPPQKFGLAQSAELAVNLCRARVQRNDPWGLNATPQNILSPVALRRSAAR